MKHIITLLSVLVALFLFSTCAKLNAFREPPDHPVIDSLAPASGTLGTQIRLYGSGFSTRTSLDTVRINGVLVRVDSPATSTVMLATIVDSTGTGRVHVRVNNQEAEGPVFTYLGNTAQKAPVITAAEFGWNDGTGYAVTVKTLPAADSSIRLLVGGVAIPIAFVTREGTTRYNPAKGYQLLVAADASVRENANGIYANFVVSYNGVRSAPYPLQLIPAISMIKSSHGDYVFAAGDTITITGNFLGDRTLPSLLDIHYNGQTLTPDPVILSWKNTEIRAVMPTYNVQVDADIRIGVKVGQPGSGIYTCKYAGVLSATVGLIAGSDAGNMNGSGSAAKFNKPAGIALNASGILYVADQGNNTIRAITNISNSGGAVSTFAGSTAGFLDGSAAVARFNQPAGVAVDANGAVYVADFGNNRIRMISGGSVNTYAGDGSILTFYYPAGIALNPQNVAFVADMNNHRIQKIINNVVFTLAGGGTAGYADGSGTAARFNQPYGVAIGPDGTVYVADEQNHAIRTINVNGLVGTLAGGSSGKADGKGAAAQFEVPRGVAVDASGNVYVADFYNRHIRKITPGGVVTTLCGLFDDGSIAYFSAPNGIATDQQGNLYVSDAGTHRIYKMILK